jgi:hypothetical protein
MELSIDSALEMDRTGWLIAAREELLGFEEWLALTETADAGPGEL